MSNNDEKPSNSRAAKPMCLARVASLVYSTLEKKQQTTFVEVADSILMEISPDQVDQSGDQRTMRRRVYDVLNVLCAAGIITKDQKIISFNPYMINSLSPSSNDLREMKDRITQKERILVERATLLLFYKLLINRNSTTQRPPTTIQLPAMFVGFGNAGNGEVKRSLDGTRLEVVAQSPPLYFSPVDLYNTLGFREEQQIACIRSIPILRPLENLLFPGRDQVSSEIPQNFPSQAYQQNNIIPPNNNINMGHNMNPNTTNNIPNNMNNNFNMNLTNLSNINNIVTMSHQSFNQNMNINSQNMLSNLSNLRMNMNFTRNLTNQGILNANLNAQNGLMTKMNINSLMNQNQNNVANQSMKIANENIKVMNSNEQNQ
ncbi:hypothetical protein TRFO_11411 [Tritrichomonas foetus]|uniref:E2F/DP family winged-helix DNA-binding domain-containing protein n=1 Tax=Tritrichomonas foetus TaxID=1144522 RepID=A0A1J4J428_9EUKA|nr:hypothetical protein TRFO_11411 [Tritrichomonas foetus]|eukprot:OHS94122.1 hypothetical protein TRFO_11411 [Tritrichomonas foetus]